MEPDIVRLTPETEVVNAVPNVNQDSLPPFDYIVTTTKNYPDVSPTLPELIAPAVTPGHTVIVMIQNGLNIERPMFEAFPTNIVLSGVSMIDSHEGQPGEIFHEDHDILYLGAFTNPNIPDKASEVKAAHDFIKIYGAAGKTKIHFSEDVPCARWRKLIFNAVLNPICAITSLDSARVRLTNSLVEGLARPAMKEVYETASRLGHRLPEDIIDTMINLDPMDLYLKPSMQVDIEKVSACLLFDNLIHGVISKMLTTGRATSWKLSISSGSRCERLKRLVLRLLISRSSMKYAEPCNGE